LGLKPQSVHKLGGFKVQGRDEQAAQRLVESARTLVSAGADAILLECVPNAVGEAIRDSVQVPVIGIGAGPAVDGQILVLYDVLGITQGRMPRFVKNFLKGQDAPLEGLRAYVRAVKDRSYPAPEHCFAQ
jgi:3-methyl-2-oxobutanoate hydroxymethyltransferase